MAIYLRKENSIYFERALKFTCSLSGSSCVAKPIATPIIATDRIRTSQRTYLWITIFLKNHTSKNWITYSNNVFLFLLEGCLTLSSSKLLSTFESSCEQCNEQQQHRPLKQTNMKP